MAANTGNHPAPPDPSTQDDLSLWRDPTPPPRQILDQLEARVLDPATAMTLPGVRPFSTIYVGPRLIISSLFDAPALLSRLQEVAAGLGWTVTPEREVDVPVKKGRSRSRRLTAAGDDIGVLGVTISVTEGNGEAVQAPDGWSLLQQARARFGVQDMRGVGLDHMVFIRGGMWGPNPGMWGPNPGMWGPNSPEAAIMSYQMPGSGGRQPVSYVGPRPHRHRNSRIVNRRPVVAVLDTGCGEHPWLGPVDPADPATAQAPVRTDVTLDGNPIGFTGDRTNPEIYPDQVGPLDGGIDAYSGHGTFICGLIHQAGPDTDILAWRAVNSAGPIRESSLIKALRDILALVEANRADPQQGHPIDVLSLSLGYYHETPEDELVDPTVWEILRRFGAAGTVVVCSAGNDATARPMYPAAFAPWADGNGPIKPDPDTLPVVSVGALNPNTTTDALFSNAGPWARVYEQGAAVLSTLPTDFEGGLLPTARSEAYTRVRESIDPDNYQGGFAVWSGTSFAAPLFAGKLAHLLGKGLMRARTPDSAAAAKRRAWSALVELTDLDPQELKGVDRAGALRPGRSRK